VITALAANAFQLLWMEQHGKTISGAFSNILTWADSASSFSQKAKELAASLNMYVADVEGAEPLLERAKRFSLTEEVEEMMTRAESRINRLSDIPYAPFR
jgi:hypothetical protein